MAAELRAWDRRADESAKAFEAFVVYRDAGKGRSLADAGEKLGKNLTTLGQWSVRHEWVKRAAAFDTEASRIAGLAALGDAAAARIRQAQQGQALAAKGMASIVGTEDAPADPLPAAVAVQAVKAGIEIERAALGMTDKTIRVDASVTHVLDVLWPEDVARVAQSAAADDDDDTDDADAG